MAIVPISSFRVTDYDDGSVSLAWTNNQLYDGIDVYQKVAGGSYSLIDSIIGTATSYNATGLDSGKLYYFYLIADRFGDETQTSAVSQATTLLPPTLSTATAASASQINLGWSNALAYYGNILIERKKAGESSYTQIASIAGNLEVYNATGLTEGWTYYFKIRATVGSPHNTTSAYSSVKSATTTLDAPSALNATVISSSVIDLDWTNNATYSSIKVYRSTDGSSYSQVDTISGSATYLRCSSLTAGQIYYYKLKGANAYTTSAYSNADSATPTLPAPTGLGATVISASIIDIAWTNGGTYTSVLVYRSTAGGAYTLVYTLSGSATYKRDSGLSEGVLYAYKLKGQNAYTTSAYSSVASATTSYPAPSSLWGSAASPTQIDLAWHDNNDDEDGFKIYRNGALVHTNAANDTTWSDTGLTPGTWYYYYVKSYKGAILSPASNQISVYASTPPSAPTGLAVTPVSDSQLHLSWIDNSSNELDFHIEESDSDSSGWAEIDTVGANVTVYEHTSLGSNELHYYRVRAHNASGYSGYCTIASGRTMAAIATPTALVANAFSGTAIEIYLQDNSSDEDDHRLERAEFTGADVVTNGNMESWASATDLSNWTESLAGTSTINREAVVLHGGTYACRFDVDASNSAVGMYQSITLTAGARYKISLWYKMSEAGKAGSFRLRDSSATVYLQSDGSWGTSASQNIILPNATDWTNFIIYFTAHALYTAYPISIGSFASHGAMTSASLYVDDLTVCPEAWAALVTLPANVTYYKDEALGGRPTANYRARAKQGASYSDYSNEASATVLAVPNAPSALTEDSTTDTTTRLTWTAPAYAANKPVVGYEIYRSDDDGATYPTLVQKIYTSVCEYLVTGLTANTHYHFRVRAFNAAGNSGYCTGIGITTDAQYEETALELALRKTSLKPVLLYEINPKIALSGFTLCTSGGDSYEIAITEDRIIVDEVLENGEPLTLAASAVAVEATAGTFYFDNLAGILYVHTTGSDDPSNYLIEAGFWLNFQNYADSTVGNIWNDEQYLTILSAGNVGSVDSGVNEEYAGSFLISGSTITLINPRMGDGQYYWDKKYGFYTFRGRKARLLLGVPGFTYAQFEVIDSGLIDKLEIADDKITFSHVDAREGMYRTLPINHYWTSEYPLMTDTNGPSKPILYGSKANCPTVCLEATSKRYGYHDGRCGGITALYINAVAKTVDVDYYDDPWHGIVTIDEDVTINDGDVITVDFNGIEQDDHTQITNHVAALRDILLNYLDQVEESDLNLDMFYKAEADCTETCSIYLSSETSSETIIRTIEQSILAFTLKDLQGRLGIRALTTTADSSVRYVANHMTTNYKQAKEREHLYYKIVVKHSEDPTADTFVETEKLIGLNRWKYGTLKTYDVTTYLTSASNALTLASEIEETLDKDIVSFSGPFYLVKVLPGDIIKITRTRFYDQAGSATEKDIRVLSVRRNLGDALGIEIEGEAV